ncbi:hypothetical protein Asp14428_77400 [Actinoplanes sp. NBRC 14428]|uniref:Putative membrane protein n=1 Tax=Pseudosporangium ferrugineum TaxID=439699 RepID=A0A2T0RX11_9ACTN|nr:hypothetical protein [Pseudosporangium ferrugineum]PRY25690.1 putative membrane protein [Pseudosporangium ferrugineum]BCJ56265.1 hypothetical protein Asp14428_77400 [Actinoplanes sp. NBRC 14428]
MTSGPYSSDTAPLVHSDVLVLDYLAALWAATDDLEPELRDELMTTVADYIAMRRAANGPVPDHAQILHRLGPPEALAAAARRGRVPAHLRRPSREPVAPMPAPPQPSAGGEYAGIALLSAGSVMLPVIGPFAGMLLVSGSARWSTAQKTAAWVLSGGPVLLAFVLVVLSAMVGGGAESLMVGYLMMVAGGFVAALSLLPGLTARRHYPQGY